MYVVLEVFNGSAKLCAREIFCPHINAATRYYCHNSCVHRRLRTTKKKKRKCFSMRFSFVLLDVLLYYAVDLCIHMTITHRAIL